MWLIEVYEINFLFILNKLSLLVILYNKRGSFWIECL